MKNKRIIIIISLVLILAGGLYLAGIFKSSKKQLVYENETRGNELLLEDKLPENDVKVVEEKVKAGNESVEEKKAEVVNIAENKETENKQIQPVVKSEEKKIVQNDEKSEGEKKYEIVDRLMDGGFQKASDRKIDTIIIHTSYNAIGEDVYDIGDIVKQYEQYNVSAHYLIGRDGKVYRLVQDKNIAWHAGVSKMPDGRTNINDFSIGIEVVNTKEGKFTQDQYNSLNNLISDLKSNYPVKNILGHDDIAPGRKTDPWGIEWDKIEK